VPVAWWRAHQGVGGAEDWSNALHTLYDVLLTLCKVMVGHCAAACHRACLVPVFNRIGRLLATAGARPCRRRSRRS